MSGAPASKIKDGPLLKLETGALGVTRWTTKWVTLDAASLRYHASRRAAHGWLAC